MKPQHVITFSILCITILMGILLLWDFQYFLVPTAVLLGLGMMVSSNVALILFCGAIPFEQSLIIAGGGSGAMVLGVCLAASYAIHVAVGQRATLIPSLRASLIGIIYVTIMFICLGFSRNPSASMEHFATYLSLLLFFVIAIHSVNTARKLRSIVIAMVIAGIIAGVYSMAFSVDQLQTHGQRLAGYAHNANVYGLIQVSIGLLGAPLALKFKRTFAKLIYGAAVLFVIVSGLFSLSRGVLVSLFLTALYGLFFLGPRYRRLFLAAVVMAAVTVFLSSDFSERFESAAEENADGSTVMRMAYLHDGIRIALSNPVFGVGLGQFQNAFSQVNANSRVLVRVPHNMYLSIFAENGAFALAAFLILLGSAFVKSRRRALRWTTSAKDVELQPLFLGVHIALVFLICEGWFATIEYSKLLWCILALGSLPMVYGRPALGVGRAPGVRVRPSLTRDWHTATPVRPLPLGPVAERTGHMVPKRPGEIVHFIGQLGKGGSEKQLFEVATALRKKGWRQTIVSLTPGGVWSALLQKEGFVVVTLPSSHSKLRRLWYLWRLLKHRECLVHSWSTYTNAYTWLCMLLLRRPWIASVRENPLVAVNSGKVMRQPKYAVACRHASCVVTNSRYALAVLQGAGVAMKSSMVVPNIVRAPGRATPGASVQSPIIVTAGRLSRRKNYHMLFEALAAVRRSGRLWKLLVAGDGPERETLQKLAADLSIVDAVTFLGEVDDVPSLMATGHICVHPSLSEGLSNTLLEAMAEGLPIVASDVDGNAELITHRVNGMLFSPGDTSALSSALMELIDNPEERRQLGLAGLKFVQEKMCGETIAERVDSLYTRLLQTVA